MNQEIVLGIIIILIAIGIGTLIEQKILMKIKWWRRLASTELDNKLEDMKVK